MSQQVLEGTWEEVVRHAERLPGSQLVRLIILGDSDNVLPRNSGRMIRKGMFPELAILTEADFRAAEFRGDSDDVVDW